jgi:hypothetical protein
VTTPRARATGGIARWRGGGTSDRDPAWSGRADGAAGRPMNRPMGGAWAGRRPAALLAENAGNAGTGWAVPCATNVPVPPITGRLSTKGLPEAPGAPVGSA